MKQITHTFSLKTQGRTDIHDITSLIHEAIAKAGVRNGIITAFTPGSTAGITTIEFEPGVVADFRDAIERLAPERLQYAHDARWGDGNGFSHVRASLLGPSLTIPLTEGEPTLGTWQQVVLVDFDNRPRQREVVISLLGE